MSKKYIVTLTSIATAVALIVGFAVGYGVAGELTAGSAMAQPASALAVRAASDVDDFEPGSQTLSVEEVSQLNDDEIDEILAIGEEAVSDAQEDFESDARPSDYDLARAAYEQISASLDQIIASEGVEGLAERFPEDATVVDTAIDSGDRFVIDTVAKRCMTVYKWQLQTIAWIAIGYGAFVSIAALFAGAVTIVGLPAGAVVAALGITLGTVASFFLWKVDQQRWNSKRVCF